MRPFRQPPGYAVFQTPRVGYGLPPAHVITDIGVGSYPTAQLRLFPIDVPFPVTLDQLGIEVTTAAAGGLVRLGLYDVKADGTPGALLVDAGTLDASTIGAKSITLASPVAVRNAGVYLAYVDQGPAPVQVRRYASAPLLPVHSHLYISGGNAGNMAYAQASVAGDLPNPAAPNTVAGANAVLPWLRVQALI